MKIRELLQEEDILMNITCDDKREVIERLTYNLDRQGYLISKQGCLQDILVREEQISTGLSNGIAIPHTQSQHVKECKISIALLAYPVEWKTIDDSQVYIVILITVPSQSNGVHLKILASLAEKLMDDSLCMAIGAAKTKKEIIQILED